MPPCKALRNYHLKCRMSCVYTNVLLERVACTQMFLTDGQDKNNVFGNHNSYFMYSEVNLTCFMVKCSQFYKNCGLQI